MAKISRNYATVSGPAGLLLAVIVTAVNDLESGNRAMRRDALKYFSGPLYRHHVEALGLPADWLPAGLER